MARDPRRAAAASAAERYLADRGWVEELAWLDTLGQATVPLDDAEFAGVGGELDCAAPEGLSWDRLDGFERPAGSWTAGFADGGVLDGLAPDPVLARFAWDACEAGVGSLSDDELVGLLLASRRLESQHAAVSLALVAELDGRRMTAAARPGSSRASEHVADELAAALALTGRGADGLLGLARGLRELPMVWAALHAGRIDLARVRVFADELAALSGIKARACAAAVIDQAGGMTTGQLRAALRRLVAAADPDAARRRAEQARAEARVEAWGEGSGNSALAGRELPPDDVIAADGRITAIARSLKAAGAPGTMDELRAAVFSALLTGRDPEQLVPAAGPAGMAGSRHPRHDPTSVTGSMSGPEGLTGLAGSVHLTMPLASWLGLCDQPGEAAGHGPLDAWSCRDLASRLAAGARARWCVTLTGPSGRAAAHACARAGPPGPHQPGNHGPPGEQASAVGWLRARGDWLRSLEFTRLESGTCSHMRHSTAYRPPSLLAHLIRVRQRTCCFPACRRPARQCDLDHTTPYDEGGITCECNLAPLCRRHHRAKQADGWQLKQPQPGVLVWSLPHGRPYTATADAYPE